VSSAIPATLKVLHLDDDPFEIERIKDALEKHALDCRFLVQSVASVADFHRKLRDKPDVIILDIHVDDPSVSGIDLAQISRQKVPDSVILICSTADDLRTIADCLNASADDFISKLSDKGELSLRVYNSYRLAKLKRGTPTIQSGNANSNTLTRPVGATAERIAARVPLIVESAISAVFITGESGTGKEVVADLFGGSLNKSAPFIKVNCGSIAPNLLESELFGHVRGAFTGATSDKVGLLEAASGGWIFLDEVATLSPPAQIALLRALENQEVRRVGATKAKPIKLRVLSATNEPIEKLVQEGKFRADLWQRLREAEINLPPLRQRPDEIPALIEYFCRTMTGGPYSASGPVMAVLSSVSWRDGNIRELRNCLRAMTEMHVNKLLTPLAIPARLWEELEEKPSNAGESQPAPTPTAADRSTSSEVITLPWDANTPIGFEHLSDLLLLAMSRKLAEAYGRMSLRGLAQATGLSRSTLSNRLKNLIHKNLITLAELSQLVGISEV